LQGIDESRTDVAGNQKSGNHKHAGHAPDKKPPTHKPVTLHHAYLPLGEILAQLENEDKVPS